MSGFAREPDEAEMARIGLGLTKWIPQTKSVPRTLFLGHGSLGM